MSESIDPALVDSFTAFCKAVSKGSQLGDKRVPIHCERFSIAIVIVVKGDKIGLADFLNPLTTLVVPKKSMTGFFSKKPSVKQGSLLLLNDNGTQINLEIKDKRVFKDDLYHDAFGFGLLNPLYDPFEKFISDSKHADIDSDEIWAIRKFRGQKSLSSQPEKIVERIIALHKEVHTP